MGDALNKVDDRGYLLDLQDLKKSYKLTLEDLRKWRKKLELKIEKDTKMTIEQFYDRKNKKYRDVWKEANAELSNELEAVKGMISNVNYAIEWLHTGREPKTSRGIDRRSVYQNTIHLDPMLLANYSNAYNSRSSSTLTEDERDRLRDALEILSAREREVYMMAIGENFSHSYIANMLGISKGTVEVYVKRAHAKVLKGWQGTLF